MRKSIVALAWIAVMGSLIPDSADLHRIVSLGPGRALADENTNTVMPPEVTGFRGTVIGTIARPPGKDWFVMKVVKVAGFAPDNKAKLSAEALTAVWKDKHVAVLLVTNMPSLTVGDTVSVTAFQFEMHLRSLDGTAVKQNAAGQPGDAHPTASQPAVKLAPLPSGVTVQRDIEYAKVGDKSLLLDIYTPAGAKGKLPLVVFIHGGGWKGGSKDECPWVYMATRGYIVASINHRLSGEAIFPACIEDCKGAIRYLRANAGKYSIDQDRIGVGGGSSGGHLASLVGTSGDVKELEGTVGGNLSVSSRVQCVADFFGPSDIMKFQYQPVWPKIDDPKSPLCELFGGLLADKQDLVAKANPINYITKDTPPFFVAHGNRDGTVPFNQSQLLVAALKKAGVEVTFEIVQNGEHGLAGQQARLKPLVDAFFDKHLHHVAATQPASDNATH